ncbi:hypothetical protein [Ensifer sesbaniae]|uniref:hypothetical protein n=1 Tax=Ensifer sesbaniae TaxID=1214071 RepID=UPI0015684D58|nr:hypothetical protein [Ensifer sesbaniae]NRQ18751.1 hypothetical protein [Ensifer sesbaniae]
MTLHTLPQADRKLKVQDLENDVCSLLHMTRIAVSHIEGVVNFEHSIGNLSDDDSNGVIFALYEIHSRAQALRDRFYEAVHGQSA